MRVKAVGRRSQPAGGRRRRIEGVQGRRRRTRCTRRVVGLCTCSSIGTRCPAVATRQIRVVGWVQTVFTARSRPKLGRVKPAEKITVRVSVAGTGLQWRLLRFHSRRPYNRHCQRAPQGAPPRLNARSKMHARNLPRRGEPWLACQAAARWRCLLRCACCS